MTTTIAAKAVKTDNNTDLAGELIEEKNEALAHIVMAFLIVIGITVIGQIL